MLAESNLFLGWDEVIRFGTVALVVWSAAWFLFNQQIKIKDLVHKKFDEVKTAFTEKLEYHERHDDQRFDNLSKDLINVRLAQARSQRSITKYFENGNDNGKHIP